MTRSELIERLAKQNPHLSPEDIERVVLTVFDDISTALTDKNRVELRGFGAFSVREREARVGRNPKTGEQVEVDTRYSIMFKAGKELRHRLNKILPKDQKSSTVTNISPKPTHKDAPKKADQHSKQKQRIAEPA